MRSYHLATGTHLVDKSIKDDNSCECGWNSRNADHILFYYPYTRSNSDKLVLNLYEKNYAIIQPQLTLTEKLSKLVHA